MATNSVYKQVRIKDGNMTKKFVLALENAQHKSSAPVTQSRKIREIRSAAEIKTLLEK